MKPGDKNSIGHTVNLRASSLKILNYFRFTIECGLQEQVVGLNPEAATNYLPDETDKLETPRALVGGFNATGINAQQCIRRAPADCCSPEQNDTNNNGDDADSTLKSAGCE